MVAASEEETVEILKGIRDKFEAHHKVKITDEAIDAATLGQIYRRQIPARQGN